MLHAILWWKYDRRFWTWAWARLRMRAGCYRPSPPCFPGNLAFRDPELPLVLLCVEEV
jgi:hypothetical protein